MSADLAFPGDHGFAAAVACARRDMAGKLQRRAALTSQLASATSDAERRALLSLAECTQTQEMLDKTRPRIALAEFEPLAVLGRGGFGEVSLVRRAGALYAMKRIPRDAAHSLAHILNERNALVLTSAPLLPWVTTLHFSFQTDTDLFFVTDWACGGDLMQMLIAKDALPEPLVRLYAAELVEAIDSCHRVAFMHRDIKPDNILLDQRGHIVLGDLGLSTSLLDERPGPGAAAAAAPASSSSSSSSSSASSSAGAPPPTPPSHARRRAFSQCGTPDYISPEVLLSHTSAEGYGEESDYWSLGAVLYECLLGFCPFFAATPVETCTRILRWSSELAFPPHRTAHLSPPCLDFLRGLLREAGGRLGSAGGAAELRAHPWLAGLPWGALRGVDVRALGGELPLGGAAEAVLERLRRLPRRHADFSATLLLALSHFDDFGKLSEQEPPPPAAGEGSGGGGGGGAEAAPPPPPPLLPPPHVPLLHLPPAATATAAGGGGASALINSARSLDSSARRRERVADFTFTRPLSLSGRRLAEKALLEGGGEGGAGGAAGAAGAAPAAPPLP